MLTIITRDSADGSLIFKVSQTVDTKSRQLAERPEVKNVVCEVYFRSIMLYLGAAQK